MAATTAPEVLDRLQDVLESEPFLFIKAIEPFAFDRQPAQQTDQVYRVEMRPVQAAGYLGAAQAEQWAVDCWWARKVGRDPHHVYRQCLTDVTSVTAALANEGAVVDFFVLDDDLDGDVQPPTATADYLVARLSTVIEFDRAL